MSERIKTFLMISVIFNALLVGVMLGQASHFFSHNFMQHTAVVPPSDCCTGALADKLPEDKRKLLDEILRPAWEKMQATHTQMDEEKKKALNLLAAEPFDEKAYRKEIQHINEIHNQMKKDMAEAVVKLAHQFTPEERAVLADIVAHSAPTTTTQSH